MFKTLEAQLLFAPGIHINVFRTHDNHLVEAVAHTGKMYHKTLISVTNQIGCPVGCDFCKVSEQRFKRNITAAEYHQQVQSIIENVGSIPWFDPQKPVKVCFTRAGEALLNKETLDGIAALAESYAPSFQFTTVMPGAPVARKLLQEMQNYLARYTNAFQINVSMHTSDEEKRMEMFGSYAKLMSFKEIAEVGKEWVNAVGNGRGERSTRRKVNLSFVLMEDNEVDLRKMRELFHPDYFAIRYALYLPSSAATAALHAPSPLDVMCIKAREARELGYDCIESIPQQLEMIWDTRPYSAFKMLKGRF